jgi:hypothetical protein
MTKRIFLLALSACALALNAHAGITVTEQVGDATVTFDGAAGTAYLAAKDAAQKQAALEKWFNTLAENGLTPKDTQMRGLYYDWLRRNRRNNDEMRRLTAVDHLSEGDPLPLANTYDDEATIRLYLHDSGYQDLSPAQISAVCAYMHKNGIRHVSQIQ